MTADSDKSADSTAGLTPRTERQMAAAAVRAARATGTFQSYNKETKKVHANAHLLRLNKFVELTDKCWARCCDNPAVTRIAVNVWGTIYEADVCEKHVDKHGKWLDSL